MNKLTLIPEFQEVPTKEETTKAVSEFLKSDNYKLIEKFVIFRAMESIAKEGLKQSDRQEVIKSALESSGGAMKFDCYGAEVQITKETITKIIKKYTFSDYVGKLEAKIEDAKYKLSVLEDELKARKVHEINRGVATDITKELTGEEQKEELGIKITMPK